MPFVAELRLHNPAQQRKAVAAKAPALKRHHRVANRDRAAVNRRVQARMQDADAGRTPIKMHPRAVAADARAEFRDFAAADRHARLIRGIVQTAHHLINNVRVQHVHVNNIGKRRRLESARHKVIYNHRHQIEAERVISAGALRKLDFRADAVGGNADVHALKIQHVRKRAIHLETGHSGLVATVDKRFLRPIIRRFRTGVP